MRQSDLIVVGRWEILAGEGDELPYDAEEARARSGDPNLALPTIGVTYVGVRVEQILKNTTDDEIQEGALLRLRLPWRGLPWSEARGDRYLMSLYETTDGAAFGPAIDVSLVHLDTGTARLKNAAGQALDLEGVLSDSEAFIGAIARAASE